MLRIGLFLLTNFAILLLAGTVLNLIGFNGIMAENGVDLNLNALLIFCGIFGFAGSFISLLMSKWMAKRSMHVHIIENPSNETEQWLVNTVADLARDANVGMPEVGIFPSPQSNAFATGWNKNKALVAVSQGLLQRMNRDEVRAVLAHEIGHVANGDMITLTLIQGIVNTFVLFFSRVIGHFVDRVILKNERGYGIGYFISVMVAQIILTILASIVVMWFSRRREFRADEAGAQLAGTGAMISALEKLKVEYDMPSDMGETFTAFGLKNGRTGSFQEKFGSLFLSHPPLDQRIEALRNRF
ncbi:protease HtpX [Kangiella profundi]|uniref:Protease HtpX n=1 Tax=Kangiella profundi TaxID=1561924 RepID=A0A2K9A617_9GAMM|nr:protease HtpX [Kangiella profundi]AUD78190.1 protease HtpX [Kangiella profundi]GGF05864.1 protease HtpX [Kangiella profundi]